VIGDRILSAQPCRVLVVDDLEDNRAVLTRSLVRRGFLPIEAVDGPSAIELIKAESFDLVLLDIVMPGMDGMDVLSWIRTRYAAETLPVMMVTALSERRYMEQAVALGANDYITKPIDLPVAFARIERILKLRVQETHRTRSAISALIA
jgi:CheY-like chemotaxis protein